MLSTQIDQHLIAQKVRNAPGMQGDSSTATCPASPGEGVNAEVREGHVNVQPPLASTDHFAGWQGVLRVLGESNLAGLGQRLAAARGSFVEPGVSDFGSDSHSIPLAPQPGNRQLADAAAKGKSCEGAATPGPIPLPSGSSTSTINQDHLSLLNGFGALRHLHQD